MSSENIVITNLKMEKKKEYDKDISMCRTFEIIFLCEMIVENFIFYNKIGYG